MFKSKLKSLFDPAHKWVKIALVALLVVLLVAILAVIGSMVLPQEEVPVEETSTGATSFLHTQAVEGQFEAPKTLTDPREIALAEQIRAAAAAREDVLAFLLYDVAVDRVDFSKDGRMALVWISLVDRDSGLVQPGEPGLVIAVQKKDPAKPWRLTFQADTNFAEVLNTVPGKLLSAEQREMYMPALQKEQKGTAVLTGYRLPWREGETVRLTGSIGHVYTYKSCPSSCLYAFDFANGTMFDVVAAKGGTVKYAVWKYENGDPKNANYLVLEDTSTTPTTYQVYLHLAQNSIPEELRQQGAVVAQGQFIAKADDTGYSTGHHLHFHVHTNPESYWGKSVDIAFEDVKVNGGRPRLCSEAKAFPQFGTECMPQDRYVSQNGDTEDPTAGFSSPEDGTTLQAPVVNVSGWLKDDVGIASAQIYLKADGKKWEPIGKPLKKVNFNRAIDLCAAGIPDGAFSLAIEVTDTAGNVTERAGEITLQKAYPCPAEPPVCKPAADEVALYAGTDFQGACQVLNMGDYPDMDQFDKVKSDQAMSIQVGANVTAALYPDNEFSGQQEIFQDGDNDLTNNPIGAANAASIRVVARVVPPMPPQLLLPEAVDTETELVLNWKVEDGIETRVTLSGPKDFEKVLDWQTGTSLAVGRLEKGKYTLVVEARNLAGVTTVTQEIAVEKKINAPETHMDLLPQGSKTTAIKLTWVVDTRAADVDHFELQWQEGEGEWMDWSEPLDGKLRGTIFWAQPDKLYGFRIRAVGKDGLMEPYTGKAEASTYVLPDCVDDAFEGEGSGDDVRTSAPVIRYDESQAHNWCQAGDVDWVVFEAAAGDPLSVRVDPHGAAAAAEIKLFAANSDDLLAEAKPQNLYSPTTLSWTAPEDGTYAVQLTPADARISGEDATYELSLQKERTIKTSWFIALIALLSILLGGGFFILRRARAKKMDPGVGW